MQRSSFDQLRTSGRTSDSLTLSLSKGELSQPRQQVSRAIAELLVVDDALGILPSVAGTRQVVERDRGVEPRRGDPAAAGRDALLPFRDFPFLARRRIVTGANLGKLWTEVDKNDRAAEAKRTLKERYPASKFAQGM